MARKRVTLLDTLAKLKHSEQASQALFNDLDATKRIVRDRDETIRGMKKELLRQALLISDLGKELDRRRRPAQEDKPELPAGAMVLIPADSELGRQIEEAQAQIKSGRASVGESKIFVKGNGAAHAH